VARNVPDETTITRVADLLNPAAALLPAANVIMQLSLPGVGYGVARCRRTVQSVRDDGLSAYGVPRLGGAGLVRIPAAAIRVVTYRPDIRLRARQGWQVV
jgi:hypothetical protein